MAGITIMKLLALAMCLQCSLGIEFYWGSNTKYNNLCKDVAKFDFLPMPDDECNIKDYVMCTRGKCDAVNSCDGDQKFNPTKKWCESSNEIQLPPTCTTAAPPKVKSTVCNYPNVRTIPYEGSCKNYTACLDGGNEAVMPCPTYSFYIHEFGSCMYITQPYVLSIPADKLKECNDMDPYEDMP